MGIKLTKQQRNQLIAAKLLNKEAVILSAAKDDGFFIKPFSCY
jgi:hypothetical protein